MPRKEEAKTPFQEMKEKHFKGMRFQLNYLKQAGAIFKKSGEEAAVLFLTGKSEESPPTFNPPAKCRIIAMSRPIEEWPIYKANVAIQNYIYNSAETDTKIRNIEKTEVSRKLWFETTGVDNFGYTDAQGLNKIFENAIRIFDGVAKKVANRNEKRKEKSDKFHTKFIEEKAFGDDGFLIQKPGVNTSVYCYKNVKIIPKNNNPIVSNLQSRLSILIGNPGYVPKWQREFLSKKKNLRRRAWYSKSNLRRKSNNGLKYSVSEIDRARSENSLVARISIKEDWVDIDIRGLIRNARWRGFCDYTKPVTIQSILDLFSGDPVIDPTRSIVTFSYKLGQVKVRSQKTVSGSRSKLVLEKEAEKGNLALLSIDLGQTNPVAARVSIISKGEAGLNKTFVESRFLPKDFLQKIKLYRDKNDYLLSLIKKQAIASLTKEQQDEIKQYDESLVGSVKEKISNYFKLNNNEIPWERMDGTSTIIADVLIDSGSTDPILWNSITRKGAKKTISVKRRDISIANLEQFKSKLSIETRDALNKAIWQTQINNDGYKKLSVQKLELARACVNDTLRWARACSKQDRVAINLENLTMKFFHGSGKREVGFDNFFKPKKENRWFIQVLHKAFCDKSVHCGSIVIESNPARTSMTCTKCGECSSENRDGQRFKCIKCNVALNADLDVATENIERVAVTGLPMPKPKEDCERPGGVKKAGIARKRKLPKTRNNTELTPQGSSPIMME